MRCRPRPHLPGEAVRVRGCVAALQSNLVRSLALREAREESLVERHAALGLRIELGHPALDAVGIELGVPGCIQRVADVRAPTVAADLDQLRSTVQRLAGKVRGRGT